MSLFVVLVGGLYLIIRWIIETSSKEVIDRRIANTKERVHKMGICEDGSEDDVLHRLRSRDKSLLEEITDELTEVYGIDWRGRYRIGIASPSVWMIDDSPWTVAYCILWSKRGKTSQSLLYSCSTKVYAPLDGERSKTILAMCRIIERNMRIYYPDFRIVLMATKVPWRNYTRPPFDEAKEYEVGVEYNVWHGEEEFRYLWQI